MQQKFKDQYHQLMQAHNKAKQALDAYTAQIKSEKEAAKTQMDAELREQLEPLQAEFDKNSQSIRDEAQGILQHDDYMSSSWESDIWKNFDGKMSADMPHASLRAGLLKRYFKNLGDVEIPFLLPLLNSGHILIISRGQGMREKAHRIL